MGSSVSPQNLVQQRYQELVDYTEQTSDIKLDVLQEKARALTDATKGVLDTPPSVTDSSRSRDRWVQIDKAANTLSTFVQDLHGNWGTAERHQLKAELKLVDMAMGKGTGTTTYGTESMQSPPMSQKYGDKK